MLPFDAVDSSKRRAMANYGMAVLSVMTSILCLTWMETQGQALAPVALFLMAVNCTVRVRPVEQWTMCLAPGT